MTDDADLVSPDPTEELGSDPSAGSLLATLSAEEVSDGNPTWTVELYADRVRFLGPDGAHQTLPREGIRAQVDLITGVTLRRILLAPLRGEAARKDPLRFEPDAWETLCDWVRWPLKKDLVELLRRRTSTALLVGLVFVISAFVNEAALTSSLQRPYLALGTWLIGVWVLAKLSPRRILFLFDSGAYAVIAAGLGMALQARFAWMDALLFLLCIGLVGSGFNSFGVYRTLREEEPSPAA